MLVTLKISETGNGYKQFDDNIRVHGTFNAQKLSTWIDYARIRCSQSSNFFSVYISPGVQYVYHTVFLTEEHNTYSINKETRNITIDTIICELDNILDVDFDTTRRAQCDNNRRQDCVEYKRLFYAACLSLTDHNGRYLASLFGKPHCDVTHHMKTMAHLLDSNDKRCVSVLSSLSECLVVPCLVDTILIHKPRKRKYITKPMENLNIWIGALRNVARNSTLYNTNICPIEAEKTIVKTYNRTDCAYLFNRGLTPEDAFVEMVNSKQFV